MGAGLGDDRTFGAGLPAGLGGDGVRRGDDRQSQSARFGRFLQPVLVDPALARHDHRSSAYGLCGLPAYSVGWSYGGRLRSGTNLRLAIGTTQSVSASLGHWIDRGLLHFARHQSIRRSAALDHAEIRSLYCALISEYFEISTVAAVPADDAWPGIAF